MEALLLYSNIGLVFLGIALIILGYRRRSNSGEPFISFSRGLDPESWRHCFRDATGYRMVVVGCSLLSLGALCGAIYWIGRW